MSGAHYFAAQPEGDARRRRIRVRLAGRELDVVTAGGVFSPDHVDTGTAALLSAVPDAPPGGNLLDLGCGWGPIALSMALEAPHATVWAVDVNERALELVRENAAHLSMTNINAVGPEGIPEDVRFATIWSNPPIRVGKAVLHELLTRWLPRLETGGEAWLVVQKNLGADSLHRWLESQGWSVVRVATVKAFRILRVRRPGEH